MEKRTVPLKGRMIIAADSQIPRVGEACQNLGEVCSFDATKPSEVADAVSRADVLLCRSTIRVGERLLNGTRVEFVGTATSGIDHVDLDWLSQHGIAFASAAGSNARSVAEYVVISLLEMASHLGRRLLGSKIGIIGAGHVGSKVAEMTSALGMEVLLHDPPLEEKGDGRLLVSLHEILACDVVSIHVPLTMTGIHRTLHLVNETMVRNMREDAILVQTSRGGVVDEQALMGARSRGHLCGLIMDVFTGEPGFNPGVVAIANLATPHIAGHSWDGKVLGTDMIVRSLFDHLGRGDEWAPLDVSGFTQMIAVDRIALDQDAILLDVLRKVYDVRVDDDAMRGSLTGDAAQLPEWFKKYRKNYRMRREFTQYIVDGSSVGEENSRVLANLGFAVKGVCEPARHVSK